MWLYVGKVCAHSCAHMHGALHVEESVFFMPRHCSPGALSEGLAHQAAEMCEGQHPGWCRLHFQVPANKQLA